MKLRSQFTILMVIFCVIFLLIGISAYYTNQQIERINEQEQIANNVVKGAYQLSYLSNDYLFHIGETRQNMQWESKFQGLSDDVGLLDVSTPEQRALVSQIKGNLVRLKDVYTQSVATIGASQALPGKQVDPELVQVAWSRFIVQNQGMIFDASQLSQMLHEESDRLQRTNTIIIFTLMGVFLVILLVIFLFFNRRVLDSISSLQEGTRIIGSGNLEYRIEQISDDEIGELSDDFNQMAVNLKKVTASKTDLEQEISRRILIEKTLRESEEQYRTLSENIPGIVYRIRVQEQGQMQFFNQMLTVLTGYTPEELKKGAVCSIDPLIHPDDRERVISTVEAAIGRKEPFEVEYRMAVKDGTIHYFLEMGTPVFDEQDQLIFIDGIINDITERKRADQLLTESTERFRIVARATNDVVWDWDLVVNSLWWNESIYTAFGYQHGDIDETVDSWYTRIHPEDRDRVVAGIHAVIDKGGQSWSDEYRFLKADSSYAYVLDRGFVIHDSAGKAIRMVGAMLDITERKRTEKELKNYSEKLEEMVAIRTRELRDAQEQLVKKEKLAVLGKLSGGVGHELRNPLGAIKNVAYFLNMALENPDEEVREMIGILNKEVARSEDIITSLLDFARPKAPVLATVNLKRLVDETLKRYQVPPQITLVNSLGSTLPEIQADSNQLMQVFGNLIINATQAMPDKGTLTISSEEMQPGWISVSVTDTGIGISDENMKKLFEPLFTTKAKGIGLGLVVIKTIVEAHGGRITVVSEVGKGTTFTVILPINPREGLVQ